MRFHVPPKVGRGLGTSTEPRPGVLEFTLAGTECSLRAAWGDADQSTGFLIFRDETSGDSTYGAGRFLSAPAPDDTGSLTLDFNRAVNPPCAFTEYATCPLPPHENRLPVAVTAGEKVPAGH